MHTTLPHSCLTLRWHSAEHPAFLYLSGLMRHGDICREPTRRDWQSPVIISWRQEDGPEVRVSVAIMRHNWGGAEGSKWRFPPCSTGFNKSSKQQTGTTASGAITTFMKCKRNCSTMAKAWNYMGLYYKQIYWCQYKFDVNEVVNWRGINLLINNLPAWNFSFPTLVLLNRPCRLETLGKGELPTCK